MGIRERLTDFMSGGLVTQQSQALQTLGSQLSESNRLLERVKEDMAHWESLSDEQRSSESRTAVRRLARSYFTQGDPFVKASTLLMTYFCFGQGIDGPTSEDKAVQTTLDDFWGATDNQQSMFSTLAQYRRSIRLLLDGDLFLIVRLGAVASKVAIRGVRADLVPPNGIIADPMDPDRALYYKVKRPKINWDSKMGRFNAEDKGDVTHYKDIFNRTPEDDILAGKIPVEENVYMMHVSVNAIDETDFGMPEAATSLRYVKHHKEIMGHQATQSAATAAFANQLLVNATPGEITGLKTSIEAAGQGADANQFVAGAVNLLGPGMELKSDRATTRANEAWTNSRMFRILIGTGFGLSMHFLGDPENANLATASAMERPVFERLRGYQSIWVDTYRKLCDFALAAAGQENAEYDIPFPHIITPALEEVTSAVQMGIEQGLLTGDQSSSRLLDALGFDDIEAELEKIREMHDADEGDQELATTLELATRAVTDAKTE